MSWTVSYIPEAVKDLHSLSRSQQAMVRKAISKVQVNPLPNNEGGYGKPLGSKRGRNLTGYFKIKLRDAGIRIVYTLRRTETQMIIIVIGIREDNEVYELAAKRKL